MKKLVLVGLAILMLMPAEKAQDGSLKLTASSSSGSVSRFGTSRPRARILLLSVLRGSVLGLGLWMGLGIRPLGLLGPLRLRRLLRGSLRIREPLRLDGR